MQGKHSTAEELTPASMQSMVLLLLSTGQKSSHEFWEIRIHLYCYNFCTFMCILNDFKHRH